MGIGEVRWAPLTEGDGERPQYAGCDAGRHGGDDGGGA